MDNILSSPGTYALLLKVIHSAALQPGALGSYILQPGCYIYVGSAFGPGGLRGRLTHHQKLARKPQWHIDYLRQYAEIEQIWYTYSIRCEHEWATAFQSLPGCMIPIPGFGSSDCRCPTHLFYFKHDPDLQTFRKSLVNGINSRSIACLHTSMVPNPRISCL